MKSTEKRPFLIEGRKVIGTRKGTAVSVREKGFAKLRVLFHVKIVGLHQLLLLGLETTTEIALESWFRGGPKKKSVAESEMKRGHKETYGLHHIPTQLPEGEPHSS